MVAHGMSSARAIERAVASAVATATSFTVAVAVAGRPLPSAVSREPVASNPGRIIKWT